VKGFLGGLAIILVAGLFVLGLNTAAGAGTLPGCAYPGSECVPGPQFPVCEHDGVVSHECTETSSTTLAPAEDVTASDDGTLPFTGRDVVQLVVGGGALLFIGWSVIALTRKPKEHTP